MRNLFINHYRQKKRRKTDAFDLVNLEFLDSRKVDNEGPAQLEIEEIESIIDDMDEKYSVPMYMLAEGFTYKEMAEKLNAPLGTVKSRIFHGRNLLKKHKPTSSFNFQN